MRVTVIGATGNIGTSLVEALAADDRVTGITGVARHVPATGGPVRWHAADIATDDLAPAVDGADAVIHLAWLIQPARDPEALWRVNLDGSRRVFTAALDAGVRTLVHGSSVGAYSPAPPGRRIDERWPRDGVPTSLYSRQKAAVERVLDDLEERAPELRIIRIRPALVGQRRAASEIRGLFLGRLAPRWLFAPGRLPLVPDPGFAVQLLHADDVADGFRRALLSEAAGPFNLAAEPPVGAADAARLLGSRTIRIPPGLARAAVTAAWRLHLEPVDAGWFDQARFAPHMDAGRAHAELGWRPRHHPQEVLAEVLDGIRADAGPDAPPLTPGRPSPT